MKNEEIQQHTAEPWKVYVDHKENVCVEPIPNYGQIIGKVLGVKKKANARRIVAAALAKNGQPEAEKADQSKYVQPIAHRLTEATQNLVKFLRQQYPWEVSEPLNSILREAENALRDPQGLEPRGIVTVVTAADNSGTAPAQ